MNVKKIKTFLDQKVDVYNQPSFINDDPISIPHRFIRQQDIEIAGFFAAILAWGNRKSIIASCNKLLRLMDDSPYDFIMHTNLKENQKVFNQIKPFVHRTFNGMDLWHLLNFLQHHYLDRGEKSLETAFTGTFRKNETTVENALVGFQEYVFNYDAEAKEEKHCRKHIATPAKGSACKRLNMYLRWMVRNNQTGVDFGLWKSIKPAQLICPLDVHVMRVATKLGLLTRTQSDWKSAVELTENLKRFDATDPVKYDFALFGLGVMEKY